MPPFSDDDIPQFHPSQVWLRLTQLKTNKATVPGDFPARLIKQFAAYIAEPLTDIINTGVRQGEYPQLYKYPCTQVLPNPDHISGQEHQWLIDIRQDYGIFNI